MKEELAFLLALQTDRRTDRRTDGQTDRQTDRRTDGRTYTFLKSPRHTDYNGI